MTKQKNILMSILILLLITISCHFEQSGDSENGDVLPEEISFYTEDSIKIYGDLYKLNSTMPLIIMFHQGGSNAKGEYTPIIPRLIEMGYNVLATDQRVGGQWYGGYNRTLAEISNNGYGDGYGYCDAYNNLEGALHFAINLGFTDKLILWGSSYSASLAIKLADKNQQAVDGVLAFSPASGRSMTDCLPDEHFSSLSIPLLMLRPPNEMESENSIKQFELASSHGHKTFVPEFGVHGSSMLVKERVGNDVEATREVVLNFLNEIKDS